MILRLVLWSVAVTVAVVAAAAAVGTSENVGTWIEVHPTPLSASDQALAYHIDGLPPTACDHSTLHIGGGKLWTWAGASENDPNTFFTVQDMWILDTSVDPPAWSIMPQTNAFAIPRYAILAAYNRGTNRITVFGGSTYTGTSELNDNLSDELLEFDIATRTWAVITPDSGDHISNSGPSARGWTDFVWSNEANPTELVIFGGTGTLDGDSHSKHAHDLDDTWTFDPITHAWTGSRGADCTDFGVVCSDAGAFFDRFPDIQALWTNFTAVGTDTAVRPANLTFTASELAAFAASLATAIQDSATYLSSNSTFTTNEPDSSACAPVCKLFDSESSYLNADGTPNFERAELVGGTPKRFEGNRLRCVDGTTCYMFGGYVCNYMGSNTFGGSNCFSNAMYILNVSSHEWSVMVPPAIGDPQYALWPSPRAFHSSTLVGRKLWIFGGSFVDGTSSAFYYNDMFVFNIDTHLWESVTVHGTKPAQRWSHTMSLGTRNDTLWMFGGCFAPIATYNDVHKFMIGLKIEAKNIRAFGDGLSATVAGLESTFQLETRTALSSNGTRTTFGDMLSWGVGLSSSLSIQAVGLFGGRTTLALAVITDLGDGVYNISYTVSQGETVSVYILLDGVHVPGSPFEVPIVPGQPNPRFASAIGTGLSGAVAGESAYFTVIGADTYGNVLTSGGLPASAFEVTLAPDDVAVDYAIADNGDGTYRITYQTPSAASDGGTFQLNVRMNGEDIPRSPFPIQAYVNPVVSRGLIIAAQALTSLGIFVLLAMGGAIYHYRDEPGIKAGSPPFMLLMLLGGVLGLASIYLLSDLSSNAQCLTFPFVLGIGFMCLMSSLFAKTWRVAQIFGRKQLSRVSLSDLRISLFPVIAVGIDVVYFTVWALVSPLRITSRLSTDGFSHFTECDSPDYGLWSVISFSYHGLLLLYGVFLATNTRSVPGVFNESRYLAVTLYNSTFSALAIPILFAFSDNVNGAYATKWVSILYAILFACMTLIGSRIYYCVYPPSAGDHFFDGDIRSHMSPANGYTVNGVLSPTGAAGAVYTVGGGSGAPGFSRAASRMAGPDAADSGTSGLGGRPPLGGRVTSMVSSVKYVGAATGNGKPVNSGRSYRTVGDNKPRGEGTRSGLVSPKVSPPTSRRTSRSNLKPLPPTAESGPTPLLNLPAASGTDKLTILSPHGAHGNGSPHHAVSGGGPGISGSGGGPSHGNLQRLHHDPPAPIHEGDHTLEPIREVATFHELPAGSDGRVIISNKSPPAFQRTITGGGGGSGIGFLSPQTATTRDSGSSAATGTGPGTATGGTTGAGGGILRTSSGSKHSPIFNGGGGSGNASPKGARPLLSASNAHRSRPTRASGSVGGVRSSRTGSGEDPIRLDEITRSALTAAILGSTNGSAAAGSSTIAASAGTAASTNTVTIALTGASAPPPSGTK